MWIDCVRNIESGEAVLPCVVGYHGEADVVAAWGVQNGETLLTVASLCCGSRCGGIAACTVVFSGRENPAKRSAASQDRVKFVPVLEISGVVETLGAAVSIESRC